MRQSIWDKFCNRFRITEACVPLFATDEAGNVKNKPVGKNQRPILMRSNECEAMILSVTDKLVDDWMNKSNQFDGMLYMMGWKQAGRFVPLYIGKTETIGKGDHNLSANIKNLHKDKSKFARWGDNYAYHMGDLSACVLPGHAEDKKIQKYMVWAECLFMESSKLKEPAYFWSIAWKPSDVGAWEEFGPTSLAFQEYLLIGIASQISSNLLNREGMSRIIP
jgi:hypothetical protein